jgi:hypothetical protein
MFGNQGQSEQRPYGRRFKEMTPTQELIATVMVGILGGGGSLEIIKYLIQRHDDKKKGNRSLKSSIAEIRENVADLKNEVQELKEDDGAIMHDILYSEFNRLTQQETITVEDRANVDYLWQRYSKRGFNHKGEILYKKICEIPVIVKED